MNKAVQEALMTLAVAATLQVVSPGLAHAVPCTTNSDCVDADPCTASICTAGTCDDTTGTPCDDGLFCTVDDVDCGSGCSGSPRDCGDLEYCTQDACNETGDVCENIAIEGCAGPPACLTNTDCVDADPCTSTICTDGTCDSASGTACDDGLYCTVSDIDCGSGCSGEPRACSDADICTEDTCSEAGDTCEHSVIEGCTGPPDCLTNTDCADSDPCTVPPCNAGTCGSPAPGTACNDGLFCNGADTCSGGICSIHDGDPCGSGTECANQCTEAAGNCFDVAGTSCTDDADPSTLDQCDGSGACLHLDVDTDADGTSDLSDNCPTVFNPDQHDSDCADASSFPAGCAMPDPTAGPGCCDGGDLCDACPAQADNDSCDPDASAVVTVGASGGSAASEDGSVTVVIPAGALAEDTSISITENGPATSFSLHGDTVLSISARPENQRFDAPVTITMRWKDRDADNLVDTGSCVGGTEDGLSCDVDADCDSSACSRNSGLDEGNLVLKHNGSQFSRTGFGGSAAPFACDDHLSGGCVTAVADCSDPSGTGEATVANCCDKTANQWTFQTCGFSEYTLGDPVAGLIPGKGSSVSDCVAEWVVNNPLNPTPADKNGLPNRAQSCTDGDATCDADGATNGQCAFRVAVCINVDDPRLIDKATGLAACTPGAVAAWTIKAPRADSTTPTASASAVALRGSVGALGASAISGRHDEVVTFTPALSGGQRCSDFVSIVVPLRDVSKAGKMNVKSRTTTSDGVKDSDQLALRCLPRSGQIGK